MTFSNFQVQLPIATLFTRRIYLYYQNRPLTGRASNQETESDLRRRATGTIFDANFPQLRKLALGKK